MGDHDGQSVGVISEPTIEILSIQSLVTKAKQQSGISPKDERWNEKIELFAVAASDGMLDFLKPSDIAKRLEPTLYNMEMGNEGVSLQEACEELILEASNSWLGLNFHYRDDITIAVSRINQSTK